MLCILSTRLLVYQLSAIYWHFRLFVRFLWVRLSAMICFFTCTISIQAYLSQWTNTAMIIFAAVGTLRNMWIGAQKHESYMNASKASKKSDKRTSRYESRARTSGSLSPSKWKGLILTSCDWRFLFFARRPLVAKFWHILVDSHLQKRLIWMDFQIRPLPWPGPVEVGLRVRATKKFDRRLH